MKCIELLERDHKVILRGIEVLEEMASRVKRGEPVDPEDIECVLRFLKDFGDQHHQAKEESALFPVLLNNSGKQYEKLRQMLFEHDQERSLAEGLEDALKTGSTTDFVHFATRLATLLRGHIYKEEFALFRLVEMLLSTEQDRAVVGEFAKFDEEFRSGEGAGVLENLRLLESLYLRRRSA